MDNEKKWYWDIERMEDTGFGPEAVSCVASSAWIPGKGEKTYGTQKSAYNAGMKVLKRKDFKKGMYALEVHDGTDISSEYYAERKDGNVTES